MNPCKSARQPNRAGSAFVDPDLMGQGIWSQLLDHRLARVHQMGATPVSATWMQNDHVKRTFRSRGATEIATQDTEAGPICLFVFI